MVTLGNHQIEERLLDARQRREVFDQQHQVLAVAQQPAANVIDDFLDGALAKLARDPDSIRVVPLVSQAGRAGMVVDAGDGRPLQAVPVSF